jgi:hypothetical protein
MKNDYYRLLLLLTNILIFHLFTGSILYFQTQNWKLVDSIRIDGFSPTYRSISCADTNNCNAVMELANRMFNRITADGGKTWSFTLEKYPYYPYETAYPDTNLCIIICDGGTYFRSTDKCRTWNEHLLGPNRRPTKIRMLNAKTGGIISYNLNPTPNKVLFYFILRMTAVNHGRNIQ